MTALTIDVNIPRFSQAVVAVATALAFVIQSELLVVITFVVLVASWAGGQSFSPLALLYVRLVRPRVDPNGPSEVEPAAPPRFAQQVGSVLLGVATISLGAGWSAFGWTLVVTVAGFAALAAAIKVCVGCIIYERTVGR